MKGKAIFLLALILLVTIAGCNTTTNNEIPANKMSEKQVLDTIEDTFEDETMDVNVDSVL